MLTIRLQRAGKRNRPEYRLVLAEKTAASQKKFVEVLGSYNPHSKALALKNEERLQYWIGQHAEVSATVHNILVSKQVISDKKVKSFTIPKKEVVAEPEAAVEAPAAEATEEVKAEETGAPEAPTEVPAETPAEMPTETSPTPETPAQPTAEAPVEEPQA